MENTVCRFLSGTDLEQGVTKWMIVDQMVSLSWLCLTIALLVTFLVSMNPRCHINPTVNRLVVEKS